MTDIAEKIALHYKLQTQICEHFDFKSIVLLSIAEDIAWWHVSGSYLKYGHSAVSKDIEKGEYYGGDVIRGLMVRKESHTLIYYDDGCGDSIYLVVKSANEVTDPDLVEIVDEA